MDAEVAEPIDWGRWLQRWDRQQAGYVPEREERFNAMLDALAGLLPDSFVALDLGCGPGSVSQRLLARFPAARAIAVDMDPVMLALGQETLGTVDGRLRWIDADLATPDWAQALGDTPIDVVLSTTALHWLSPQPLVRLYRDLAGLLPSGGLLLNGDHIAFDSASPTFAHLSERALAEQWTDGAFAARNIETAEQWWDALRGEPALAPLLAEQTRRFAVKQRPESTPSFDDHVAALRKAGFREVGTIWQVLSNRVLLAVR
jgi:trans-aconitate methyltransferase